MKRTTRKTIGQIPYSLVAHTCNPSDKNSVKKIYPVPQRGELVGLAALAAHIHEHNSIYSQGTIYGIITDMVNCIKEQLMLGNFVNLDGLCRMFYTFKASGVDKVESFSSSMIKMVKLRAEIDAEFQQTLNTTAKFVYVGTRKEQAAQKKAEKEALDEELTGGSGGEGGGGNEPGDDEPGGDVTE